MTGLTNSFDSDSIRIGDDEPIPNEMIMEIGHDNQYAEENEGSEVTFMSLPSTSHVYEPALLEQNDKENEEPDDWSTYTPNQLRRPVSQSLKVRPTLKKSTVKQQKSTKYVGLNYRLMEEKLAFVKLHKETFLEKHALRMKNLKLKNKLLHKKLNL